MFHLFFLFLYIASTVSHNGMNKEIAQAWIRYKLEYGKSYEKQTEELTRFLYFSNKYIYMLEHNEKFMNGEETFTLGLNSLSDRTVEEEQKLLGFMMSGRSNYTYKEPTILYGYIPSLIDWRIKGAVTPVKTQGRCGSGYAFATTGSMESHWYIYKGRLRGLSEQQLVDCSSSFGNGGCKGGMVDNAYKYLMDKNKGCDREAFYKYVSGATGVPEKMCSYRFRYAGAFLKSYETVAHMDEAQLALAVATRGPVAVALDASLKSFYAYQSGIYEDSECSKDKLNHGALVVGYGTENEIPYWIVKNSWGANWGENGYIRIRKDSGNMCGIASMALYPVI